VSRADLLAGVGTSAADPAIESGTVGMPCRKEDESSPGKSRSTKTRKKTFALKHQIAFCDSPLSQATPSNTHLPSPLIAGASVLPYYPPNLETAFFKPFRKNAMEKRQDTIEETMLSL